MLTLIFDTRWCHWAKEQTATCKIENKTFEKKSAVHADIMILQQNVPLHSVSFQILIQALWQQQKERNSYPHCSSYGSDDEPPGWLGLLLPIICVFVLLFSLILSILLLLFWRAERVSNLYVTLIQSNLLPFEVGFLIKHPPKGLKRRRKKRQRAV